MSYLLLIIEPTGQRHERGLEAGRAAYDRMVRYAESLQSRGLLIGMNSLKADGARLTSNGGKPAVVDGPFTEAKELVGGYFLVDVATRAEALALAAECPASEWATVEVRETGPCYE
ncbi:MAG TPA: YciI family protein [Steroidobacteraceae bacterium]|nr:dehydrogenase [Gammaproteobacteria bacterium]HEV2284450.1 YciI family protein [Steroidobacteraceae bacterium]